jgi:hypothetical protein
MERILRAALLAALATPSAWVLPAGGPALADPPPATANEAVERVVPDAALRPLAERTAAPQGVVRLRLPAPGATVSGRVRVHLASGRLTGVRRVDLLVDGVVAARLRPRGRVFAGASGWFDGTRLEAGRHRIRLVITRRTGVTARARTVLVTTANTTARAPSKGRGKLDTTGPSVAMSTPAAGATVSGSVSIRADAADPSGVARVDIAVDGTLLFSDTTAPYGDAGSWSSTTVGNGAHRVSATAVDTRGNPTSVTHEVTVSNPAPSPVPPPPSGASRIYWGAWIDGDRWGFSDAPWDARTMDRFEAQAGKRVSILHWGQAWYRGGVPQPFYPNDFEAARRRGAIPLIDWNSWDLPAPGSPDMPAFQLQDITAGTYDSYIRSWATAARNWGRPFFLRFDHEMNGTWYPWSEIRNGNRAGEYVAAWRHVHDIFESVGATNVSWVWSPNTVYPGSIALSGLYPGDADVDWVAMDGYNWGTNPLKPAGWTTFAQVFKATYDALGTLAPAKPVMIAETGSSEWGGSKAAWITDALGTQLPTAFPRVKALVWFDWNADGHDWVIESSATSQAAFANGISAPMYAANEFANLPPGPIAAP